MDRLTFDGRFCDIAQCTETPGGSFCEDGYCSQRKVWERLKQYEDTNLAPEGVVKLLGKLIQCNAELVDARNEIKKFYNGYDQLDASNSSLMAANEKLAADRKALINELCQYCGKYKKAHKGTCDGCRWKQ